MSLAISKVLKILLGLNEENVEQRVVGVCRWAVKNKGQVGLSWDQSCIAWACLGSAPLLEGLVLVPVPGCFACWVFCLS